MVLINHVYDARRVIEHLSGANSNLRQEVEELKSGARLESVVVAEQHASDLVEEVERLKTELKDSRARVRILVNELLTLSRDIESAKSASWLLRRP